MKHKTSQSSLLITTILLGSIAVAFLWTLTETTEMSYGLAKMIDNFSFVVLRVVLVIAGILTAFTVARG